MIAAVPVKAVMAMDALKAKLQPYAWMAWPEGGWRAERAAIGRKGSWWHEPDVVVWRTVLGHVGIVQRGAQGAWCGYVGLARDFAGVDAELLEVHGGVNWERRVEWSEDFQWFRPSIVSASWSLVNQAVQRGLQRSLAGGAPVPVHFLGFDCAHAGDDVPAAVHRDGVYRDFAFVVSEVEKLAAQCTRERAVLTTLSEVV